MKSKEGLWEALTQYWQPLFVLVVMTFAIFQASAEVRFNFQNREMYLDKSNILAIEFTLQSIALAVLPVAFLAIFRQFPKQWHELFALIVAIFFGALAGRHHTYLVPTAFVVSIATAILFGLAVGFRATFAFSVLAASMMSGSIPTAVVTTSVITTLIWSPLIVVFGFVLLRRGFNNWVIATGQLEWQ